MVSYLKWKDFAGRTQAQGEIYLRLKCSSLIRCSRDDDGESEIDVKMRDIDDAITDNSTLGKRNQT